MVHASWCPFFFQIFQHFLLVCWLFTFTPSSSLLPGKPLASQRACHLTRTLKRSLTICCSNMAGDGTCRFPCQHLPQKSDSNIPTSKNIVISGGWIGGSFVHTLGCFTIFASPCKMYEMNEHLFWKQCMFFGKDRMVYTSRKFYDRSPEIARKYRHSHIWNEHTFSNGIVLGIHAYFFQGFCIFRENSIAIWP